MKRRFATLILVIALVDPFLAFQQTLADSANIGCAVTQADWVEFYDQARSLRLWKQEQVQALVGINGEELHVDYHSDPEGWRLTDGTFVSADWTWRGMLEYHRQGEALGSDYPMVWIAMNDQFPDLYFLFPYGVGDFAAFADAQGEHYGNHPCTALYIVRADLDPLLVKWK